MADTEGDYTGSSAEINGAGFAGMKFTARATSTEDFNRWVQGVQRSSNMLDSDAYKRLLTPSKNNPVVYYSAAQTELYDTVLMKYIGSGGGESHNNHTEQE